MLCPNAEYNEFGRLVCAIKTDGVEKSTPQLCPYQKYCHFNCKWENSPAMDKCSKRRKIMGTKNYNKKEDNLLIENSDMNDAIEMKDEVEIASPVVETSVTCSIVKNIMPVKVAFVAKYSVRVETEDGRTFMVRGYTDRKVGDVIEIEKQ